MTMTEIPWVVSKNCSTEAGEPQDPDAVVTLVSALWRELPQAQCGRCGFPTCRRYAESIAAGKADLNLCPPGGTRTRNALQAILGNGVAAGVPEPLVLKTAYIEEDGCIGCTKCMEACPVDAIVGAKGLMHSVVDAWCPACELCVAVCPTDCIEMRSSSCEDRHGQAAGAAARFEAKKLRIEKTGSQEFLLVELGGEGASKDKFRNQVLSAVNRARRS